MDLWLTRKKSLDYLKAKHPAYLLILDQTFTLIDQCVDAFEEGAADNDYSRLCGLTLLKAKNFSLAMYSLILDGLGQESGAVARPMIEYAELLTYFRMFPASVDLAINNKLPSAGKRAKAIGGIYEEFRKYLNEHAAHSSYSHYSLSHLLEPSNLSFRKLQVMAPVVLNRNIRDLAVQIQLMLRESVLALLPLSSTSFQPIANAADSLRERTYRVFELNNPHE